MMPKAQRGAGMMPNGLIAIIKKEFTRFFTDRRMVITTVIMPGLLFYLIYSFMGSAMSNMLSVDDDYLPVVYTVDAPPSVAALLSEFGMPLMGVSSDQVDAIKQKVESREVDLLLVFPADFESALAGRNDLPAGQYRPPNIEIYYNSARTESAMVYGVTLSVLESYKDSLSPTFDINRGDATYNLVSEQDATGFVFASLFPMLILIFLYSGCIGVAPESIAGEKERGTIATLLVTPLKRWQFALGKVLSLGVFALLAGASSFIAVMLSMPKMMSAASGGDASSLGMMYGVSDYLILLVVIMSTVLLFIGIIAIISAFAKSVREANTMIMPMMIVVMLVGVSGMFTTGAQSDLWYYLIPTYNSVQCFVGVFSYSASPLFVTVTVLVNLLFTAACIFALTKMFNSEKIVFAR